jgi:hypothetical protein
VEQVAVHGHALFVVRAPGQGRGAGRERIADGDTATILIELNE